MEERTLLSLSVGNLVWNDLSSNGIQDAGEPGVAGAAVEIFRSPDSICGNPDDVSVGQAITDANGNYSLGGLADATNYYLVVRPPVGFTFTAQARGSDRTLDSDVNSFGQTAMFTLPAGSSRTDLDAGLICITSGFEFPPPYAPQTNPIERVWRHPHEVITRNHCGRMINQLVQRAFDWPGHRSACYIETSIYPRAAAA
jgi:hypothetical protein